MLERQRTVWPSNRLLWPGLAGLAGSVAIALAAPRLVADPAHWWFSPRLGSQARILLYAGMAAMVFGWLGVARHTRVASVRASRLGLLAGIWSLPLLLAPPLFSHDVFSYLAQGTIAHLGLSPYAHPPTVLAHLGHAKVLHAVSPFWRGTTAPYGPLFIALSSWVVAVTGSNLVLGVVVLRLIDFLGLLALAICVPRLAKRMGGSPERALWLTVVNPLVILQLVAPGHNDLLMAGLLVAGLALAAEGRALPAIALCTVAATIKLPAFAAVPFIAVSWIRSLEPATSRVVAVARAAGTCAAVLVLISLISGQGSSWVTSSVFSTPNRVHLAITPSTALGWTIASALRAAGWHVSRHGLESAFSFIALGLVVLLALVRLRRVRLHSLAPELGVVLVAFAAGGPAAWPWYFAWGIVLLAACPPGRLALAIPVASVVGSFLIKPDGILILPIQSAPAVLAVYAAGAVLAWRRQSGRTERVVHAAA